MEATSAVKTISTAEAFAAVEVAATSFETFMAMPATVA